MKNYRNEILELNKKLNDCVNEMFLLEGSYKNLQKAVRNFVNCNDDNVDETYEAVVKALKELDNDI